MTAKLEIYLCEVCGNMVEVIAEGAGTLVCCGADMVLLEEQTADATKEKHVPVVEKTDDGFKVTVGSVPHPMIDNHYIQWIEIIADGTAYRKFLEPGDAPEATFCIDTAEVTARENCNIHGLWKG